MFNKIKSYDNAFQQLRKCSTFSDVQKFMSRLSKYVTKASISEMEKGQKMMHIIHGTLSQVYDQTTTHGNTLEFMEAYTTLLMTSLSKDQKPKGRALNKFMARNVMLLEQCSLMSQPIGYLQFNAILINQAHKHDIKIPMPQYDVMTRHGQTLFDQVDQYPSAINLSNVLNNLATVALNANVALPELKIDKNLQFLKEIHANAPEKFRTDIGEQINRMTEVKSRANHLLYNNSNNNKPPAPNKQAPSIKKLKR